MGMKDFNILFFQQKTTITSFCGILWGLIELGYDVKQGRDLLPDGDYDEVLLNSILKDIDEMLLNGADAKEGKDPIIITQDFCAVAAEAAHMRNIRSTARKALFTGKKRCMIPTGYSSLISLR